MGCYPTTNQDGIAEFYGARKQAGSAFQMSGDFAGNLPKLMHPLNQADVIESRIWRKRRHGE
jgi:hypothetical protein